MRWWRTHTARSTEDHLKHVSAIGGEMPRLMCFEIDRRQWSRWLKKWDLLDLTKVMTRWGYKRVQVHYGSRDELVQSGAIDADGADLPTTDDRNTRTLVARFERR